VSAETLTDAERSLIVALVKAEAFKIYPNMTVEQNAINFAIKIFLFAKTGVVPNGKTDGNAQ
jgi:hypothetical protein